jgi:hypothetical protein
LRDAWRVTTSLIYNNMDWLVGWQGKCEGRSLFFFSLAVLIVIMISGIERILNVMTAVRGVGRIVRVDLRVH